MSNSECVLIAALWEVSRLGIELDILSLKEFFEPDKKGNAPEKLIQKITDCDGILLSGPVYFGDRSSFVHDLIQILRDKKHFVQSDHCKFFVGITVGAKRNGGQETTLIYQLLDMVQLGFLGIGNDAQTTAQYGGTCHAGNIGTVADDEYGIWTARGAGRRIAYLIKSFNSRKNFKDKIKVAFVLLQDAKNIGRDLIHELTGEFNGQIIFDIIDVTRLNIKRCLACDFCPAHIDRDEKYKCCIGDGDDFHYIHPRLLDHDVIIPVTVSTKNVSGKQSNYQLFMERTRYLRRGDYALSDVLVSPLVIEEVGVNEHMDVRMITSLIRHNTIISKPIIGNLYDGDILNKKAVFKDFADMIVRASRVGAARLASAADSDVNNSLYNPIGYVLKSDNIIEEKRLAQRREMINSRFERMRAQAKLRLEGNM